MSRKIIDFSTKAILALFSINEGKRKHGSIYYVIQLKKKKNNIPLDYYKLTRLTTFAAFTVFNGDQWRQKQNNAVKKKLIYLQVNPLYTKYLNYWESWQRSATPRMIQCSEGLFVGIHMAITKLVECPVVESTPRRSDVL